MRITAKGQVTIPQEVRERAGLMPGADVEFEIEAGAVRLIGSTAPSGPRLMSAPRRDEQTRGTIE